MNDFESLIFQLVESSAPLVIKNNGHFEMVPNESKTRKDYSTLFFVANSSVYRSGYDPKITVAILKKTGKTQYVMFSDRFKNLFDSSKIQYSKISSENYIRLNSLEITAAYNDVSFPKIIEHIILKSFNCNSFGCCARYEACSNARKCLHEDYFYASAACQYKKHLESGNIFYGENSK